MTVLSSLFLNLCLLVTFTFAGGLTFTGAQTGRTGRHLLRYLISVVSGAALIYYGVTLIPGVRIDFRFIPVALAGLLGGPLPTFAVALPIALYRLYVGGTGAPNGVVGLLVCATVSSLLSRRFKRKRINLRAWWVPFAIFGASDLTVLLVPEQGFTLFKQLYFPLVFAHSLGLLLAFFVVQTRFHAVGQAQTFKSLAHRDALTSAMNRRAFDRDLKRAVETIRTRDYLLVLDLDHFKAINDRRGHPFGDQVLVELTQLLFDLVGREHRVYRIGGEEFAVLFHGVHETAARRLAERVRFRVEAQLGQRMGQGQGTITVSLGLAVVAGSSHLSLAAADQLLYMAKETGRNQVCSQAQAA